MGSGIRAMLLNERYRGVIHWNTSEWRKNPDTGQRKRVDRPRSEWITHQGQRIVSDEIWKAVQRRMRPMPDDQRLKAGGKSRYLLSGLLRCGVCRAHYILASAKSYACASYHDGRSCANGIRARRDHAERVLLDPIRNGLLAPERIMRMASEMEQYYREQLRQKTQRAAEAPRELQDLEVQRRFTGSRLPLAWTETPGRRQKPASCSGSCLAAKSGSHRRTTAA